MLENIVFQKVFFRTGLFQNNAPSLPFCNVINGHYFDNFREKKNVISKNENLLGQLERRVGQAKHSALEVSVASFSQIFISILFH